MYIASESSQSSRRAGTWGRRTRETRLKSYSRLADGFLNDIRVSQTAVRIPT